MKKLAIFLAIMLIPFTAFALDTISDNDLNDVTGQAGVSIYTNSIQIVKTGVTTTYTDEDTSVGALTIVDTGTTTQIYFGGVDPIMIDIIEMDTLDTLLAACNMNMDSNDYGTTGVQITLPDSITIVNVGSTKSYYAAGTDGINDANRFITVTVTGGSTTISQADPGFSAPFTSLGSTGLRHDDQLKIIISAHDGDG